MVGQDIPWLFRSRGRLALGLAFGLLVPMLGAAGLITAKASQTLRREAEARLKIATDLSAQVVDEHFTGLTYYVESFARRQALVAAVARQDIPSTTAFLEDVVSGSPFVTRAFVADPSGVEIADHPHDPDVIGRSFAHRDWYQGVTRDGRSYLSGVYLRAAEPRAHTVAFATTLADEQGTVAGYLVVQHTVETLSKRLADVRPSTRGKIALIDRNGVVANHSGGSGAAPPALRLDPAIDVARQSPSSVVESNDPLLGERSLLSFTRLEQDGWLLMAYEPLSVILAPAHTLQWVVLGLTVLCFLILFGLSFSATDAFRRQHQALLDLETTKQQLTGMLVHDLRNPLTAIISCLELARSELPTSLPQVAEDLATAASSARELLTMTNVLVDISRMEDGEMPVEKAPHDLVDLLRSKVEEYGAAAAERRLRLTSRLPDDSVVARVDRDLIARVVDNLITNALKHTAAAGEVTVELESRSQANTEIFMRVRDTGEGIPKAFLPKLFQRYGRSADQVMGTPYDAGLGLVFCRMAIELHGGRIGVESTVGEGTLFSIELPAT